MRVGLDIGSTTIKCVVLDENDTLLYSTYERHYSHILEKAQELLRRIDAEQLHGRKALLSISGSAGMGLADSCGVPFVQEVFSTRVAVKKFVPATDCVIELGGEDAKILFLTNGTEAHLPQRLGGTAAALSARHARDGQGQFDVGEDGLVGDEVIALEHEADGVVAVGVPVPVGVAAGGDAVDDELAVVVAVEAADDVEQRGLARAAGAEDGDEFAVAQVEADPVERCLCQIAGGVFLFDIDKLKHWPAFPAAERGSVC